MKRTVLTHKEFQEFAILSETLDSDDLAQVFSLSLNAARSYKRLAIRQSQTLKEHAKIAKAMLKPGAKYNFGEDRVARTPRSYAEYASDDELTKRFKECAHDCWSKKCGRCGCILESDKTVNPITKS